MSGNTTTNNQGSVTRSNNLFAAADWTTIYQQMSAQINFNSYDFATIKSSLVAYIQANYPESFNDFIESSEFVAIIELFAYLGSSLAFRIDLNTRENFLDTATRRESILRLARMLSYSPRRCIPSQGLLKLTQVITDQRVFDSNGLNLANTVINWQDGNNPDWYEQFVIVLNASFTPSNPFGQPVKSGTVGSNPVARYDFENTLTSVLAYPFTATVNGSNMNFEFCNSDFTTQTVGSISVGASGYYQEKSPSIFNPISLLYLNDGNGNASANTGFFMLFKEGTFAFTDYILSTPVPNRVIDVGAININQSDVWVQTVDDNGLTLASWTKVPAIASSNLVYNGLNRQTRNIFQVVTTDNNGNDSISIRFGDGNFGNIPTGRIRVYYRTSNNLTYSILPTDMNSVGLSFSYVSSQNAVNNLQMTFALQTTVANSLSRETATSIQTRAPAVFYTQNRMVNGEDYNVFPLQSSSALKIKAVNRVYSGQSRQIDINDPTSNYQSTKVFSDDGILFQEPAGGYSEVAAALNLTPLQIFNALVQPILTGTNPAVNVNVFLRDFYLQNYPRITPNTIATVIPGAVWPTGLRWMNATSGNNSNSTSAGEFQYNHTAVDVTSQLTLALPDNLTTLLRANSLVLFANGAWSYVIDEGNTANTNYTVVVSGIIPSGTLVSAVIPSFNSSFTPAESTLIQSAIAAQTSFGITYHQQPQGGINWTVISKNNLAVDAPFLLSTQGHGNNLYQDASWLIQFKWVNGSGWQITNRGMRYVFESLNDVRFNKVSSALITDPSTGLTQQDNITVLKVNSNPLTGAPVGTNIVWTLQEQEVYADGFVDPARVVVNMQDSNSDGIPDNPDQFTALVNTLSVAIADASGLVDPASLSLVFWKNSTQNGFDYLVAFQPTRIILSLAALSSNWSVSNPIWNSGDIVYVVQPGLFFQYQPAVGVQPSQFLDVTASCEAATGRGGIIYSWQHIVGVNDRIDPAIMNIIDVYVLTSAYDTSIRNWISTGNASTAIPTAPLPEDLRITFQDFENYKMMTDQIVWHPVSYKILFGALADPSLRVVFKVVKIPSVNITDSELKSQIVQTINNYFSIANWGFGQSFFFTELAAYIHQQNPGQIGSVVIVPLNSTGNFGDLFEITCDPDEIFISSARVTDIQIVSSLSPTTLRMS